MLSEIGQIDLLIHDSMHSERNGRFELDHAGGLKRGGAIAVDDVDANWGFRTFTDTLSGEESLVCEAEPLRPDLKGFNEKGLFGIILERSNAQVRPEFSALDPTGDVKKLRRAAGHS